MNAIEVKSLNKTYKLRNDEIKVLNDLNYFFEYGKFYLITGHSGSGKSTLLHLIGLIDNVYSGEINICEKNIDSLKQNELAKIRNQKIGYIFQEFYLDKYLTAQENIMMPMLINKKYKSKKEMTSRSLELINNVGLLNRKKHYPKELSGGEQQRICIARSLANNPDIILADEPTGNLDIKNEEYVFNLLKELSKNNKCVVMVSHSKDALKYADVILEMKDGKLMRI